MGRFSLRLTYRRVFGGVDLNTWPLLLKGVLNATAEGVGVIDR
jgi:hypothetical protein